LRAPRHMRIEPVPHEEQRLADLTAKVRHARDYPLAVDSALEVPRLEPSRVTVERGGHDHDARHLAPAAHPPVLRRVPDRRSRGAYASPKRVTRVVHDGKRPPLAPSSSVNAG
jgi:hypothetical protein